MELEKKIMIQYIIIHVAENNSKLIIK
jgi:hypothetical protein